MLHCGACGKFLSAASGANCSVRPGKYHKACVALPERTAVSKNWVCPNCTANVRKGDNSQTPVRAIGRTSPITTISEPGISGDACDSKEDQRDRVLAEFMAEMREFRREMAVLRESFSARLEGVEQRLGALEQHHPDPGTGGAAELERTITKLKQELNDRDQEALLSDLEIGRLPEDKGVSVAQSVIVLAGRLRVTLEQRDVAFAERVGPPPAEAGGRPRRVVVCLARRQLRDELLAAARVRRTLTGPNEGRVFLNERLTRQNRQLFHLVREECKKLQWRYSWTRRGRIYVRIYASPSRPRVRTDGSPAYMLKSQMNVDRVLCPTGI
ncbi:unnamed protein product [Diatraea saccharalis]|uniref:FP protein C-terminal domain-containing protein n=1 Tax=Diatraea saccharalis TaxID=40085 RepID=A0A9N9R672_9NEOP|nr:unnamed protein product [Diatraea saccharalis]